MQTGAAKGFGGIIVLHIFLNSKNSVGSVGSASSFCLLSAEIFLFFFLPCFPCPFIVGIEFLCAAKSFRCGRATGSKAILLFVQKCYNCVNSEVWLCFLFADPLAPLPLSLSIRFPSSTFC